MKLYAGQTAYSEPFDGLCLATDPDDGVLSAEPQANTMSDKRLEE